ncbi:MAG: BamA/TamA family outer membrane protein, partial [Puniceicoccales bacterium]|nr:BamA/TamA family outer membrane protein [Puniceicoccales bacterium]
MLLFSKHRHLLAFLLAAASGFAPESIRADTPAAPAAAPAPAAAVAPAAPAPAAAAAPAPAKQGIVTDILYRFDGTRKIDVSEAAAHMRLKIGQPFSQEATDASIRAFYRTGFYEYVSIDPALLPDGSVRVSVTLTPRLRISKVEITGNKEWDTETIWGTGLIDEVLVREGDPLDEVMIKRSVEKLVKKYSEIFPFSEITPVIVRNDAEGTATVTFEIKEGLNIAIRELIFEGNKHIAESDLRPIIETSSWAYFFDPADFPGNRFAKLSWLRTPFGRFNKDTLDTDIDKLRDFYRNQGFLDAEIPRETVERKFVESDLTDGWLSVKIRISEGGRYTVGDIKIEGNTLGAPLPSEDPEKLTPARAAEIARFKSDAIIARIGQRQRDLTRPYPIGDRVIDFFSPDNAKARNSSEIRTNFDSLASGDWFSPKAVETAAEKIRDYYGQLGYLNTYAQIRRVPDVKTGKVDIIIKIHEGKKTRLGAININGNTKTRNRVITREILMAPGEVFDTVRMKSSETILRNTRFFETVRLSPQVSNANVPDMRDLRIDVTEGQTGSLSFGVGFDTVQQLYGYAEYSESNFDIFNWRNNFRGGGQKFRARASIGTVSSSLSQSFEEPWVGGRELAIGYEVFLQNNSYESSDFEIQDIGLNINARRRIYGEIYATLNYNIKQSKITNIAWTLPDFIRQEEGAKIISKVGLSITRNTANDYYFPTSGNRFSLSQWVAGGPFGGDVNYYSIEARAAQWIPIFDAA